MGLADGDALLKRQLKVELGGPSGAAAAIAKRIATLKRSRSFVDWHKVRALAEDLNAQRLAIGAHVTPVDPHKGQELLWDLLDLAEPTFDRCDDSNGVVGAVFTVVASDLAAVVCAIQPNPVQLAKRIYQTLADGDYGQLDELITECAPALGAPGLAELKRLAQADSTKKPEVPDSKDRVVIGWSMAGPFYADQLEASSRAGLSHRVLKEVAELSGDLDGWLVLNQNSFGSPGNAADGARRLMAAGRMPEALALLDKATISPNDTYRPTDWEVTKADVLEALDRHDEAQALRWSWFEAGLSPVHLRTYAARLGDFDDEEAIDIGLDLAMGHRNVRRALRLLMAWPDMRRAGALIEARHGELDGNDYELLTEAADLLASTHPLAATLARRVMVEFTLDHARSKRYKHGAKHVAQCAASSTEITDWGSFPNHDSWLAALKKRHARKDGFWAKG